MRRNMRWRSRPESSGRSPSQSRSSGAPPRGPAVILHDRRMPQGRRHIDHVAIAPTGVFVIDAKAHSGNVRIDSPLFGSAKLRIAGRDSTKLIDGLDRQVAAVSDALARAGHPDVTVQGFCASPRPISRCCEL